MTNVIQLKQALPKHWIDRVRDSTPMSYEEMEAFCSEAGPYFDEWVGQISNIGRQAQIEAAYLGWEHEILKAENYYDDDGKPRKSEVNRLFTKRGVLKPFYFSEYDYLRPAILNPGGGR